MFYAQTLRVLSDHLSSEIISGVDRALEDDATWNSDAIDEHIARLQTYRSAIAGMADLELALPAYTLPKDDVPDPVLYEAPQGLVAMPFIFDAAA